RNLNSRLHGDLETVCLKCLEKEPHGRYPSAAAVADDLERWLRGEAVRARRVGALGRGWRWCRRNPVLAGLTALLALVLLGGVSGIVFQWRQAEAARRDAVASDIQAESLLNELIDSGPIGPMQMRYRQGVPNLELLLK